MDTVAKILAGVALASSAVVVCVGVVIVCFGFVAAWRERRDIDRVSRRREWTQ